MSVSSRWTSRTHSLQGLVAKRGADIAISLKQLELQYVPYKGLIGVLKLC